MPLTIEDQETRAWLRLNAEPALSAAQCHLLLTEFGMPQTVCAASAGQLARYLDQDLAIRLSRDPEPPQAAAIDAALDWLKSPNHHLLTLADPGYPPSLLELTDPPPVLFAHGDLDILRRPMIAIVGARSATPAGLDNASAFARHLAQQGWTITSGLASGIDGAAHRGALDAGPDGGGTVAVLGTGIDLVYPAAHRGLAHRIAEHGLLLSEFPFGTRALPFHFPMRNRIVAALSRGVLVVEAARRSGSLITARLAGELGREVFAIPGSIHSPLSHGCHALIRQGAKLVESGRDIVEDLRQDTLPGLRAGSPGRPPSSNPAGSEPTEPASADPAQNSILTAMGYEPVDLDTLQTRTGIAIGSLMHHLTLLEISRHIRRQPDGRYARLSS